MAETSENNLKNLEMELRNTSEKLRTDLGAIRGNRPSVDLIQGIKVSVYNQIMDIKQLGSITIMPPRSVVVNVWDKKAVGVVMKAIESAKIGLSVSNDGNNVIASLSQLGNERREELMKLVKKTTESLRIQVRSHRDEAIKKIKELEANKEISEDESFKTKEKVQKIVDDTNRQIESLLEAKLKELSE
ncbi:MAG: ribosome-recycling factor [Patescibacteria group bacterium]